MNERVAPPKRSISISTDIDSTEAVFSTIKDRFGSTDALKYRPLSPTRLQAGTAVE
jgi:hypothetical protein